MFKSSKHREGSLELLPPIKGMNNIAPPDMLDSNTATILNGVIKHNGNYVSISNPVKLGNAGVGYLIDRAVVINNNLYLIGNNSNVYDYSINDSIGKTEKNVLFGFGKEIYGYNNGFKMLNMEEDISIEYERNNIYNCFNPFCYPKRPAFALNRIWTRDHILDPSNKGHQLSTTYEILYGDDSLFIYKGIGGYYVMTTDFVSKPLTIDFPLNIFPSGYRDGYMYIIDATDSKRYKCNVSIFREVKDSYRLDKSQCSVVSGLPQDAWVIDDPEVYYIRTYILDGYLNAVAYDVNRKEVTRASIENKGVITVDYFNGSFVFGVSNNKTINVFNFVYNEVCMWDEDTGGHYRGLQRQISYNEESKYNESQFLGFFSIVNPISKQIRHCYAGVSYLTPLPDGSDMYAMDGFGRFPLDAVTYTTEVIIKRGDNVLYHHTFTGVQANLPPVITVDRRDDKHTLYIQSMFSWAKLSVDRQLNTGVNPVVRNGRVVTFYDNNLYYSAIGEIDFMEKGTDDSGKILEVGYKEDGSIVNLSNAIDLIVFKDNKKVHRVQSEYPNWIVSTIGESSPPISNIIIMGSSLIYYCEEGLKQIDTTSNYGDYTINNFPSNVRIEDCKSILVSKKRNSLLFATSNGIFEFNIDLKSWSKISEEAVENLIEFNNTIFCLWNNYLYSITDGREPYSFTYGRQLNGNKFLVKAITLYAKCNEDEFRNVEIDIGNGKTYNFEMNNGDSKIKKHQIATTNNLQPKVTVYGDITINKIIIDYAIIGDE